MTVLNRKSLFLVAAAAAVLGASPALACIGEPPPPLPLVRADGPALLIGRVVQVESDPTPERTPSFEIFSATATVQRLEALQGEPEESYRVTGAERVRTLTPSAPMYCGDFQQLKVGDVVFAMERPDGTLRAFRPEQTPAEFLPRLEAHRSPTP
jgi:hypothetical protein